MISRLEHPVCVRDGRKQRCDLSSNSSGESKDVGHKGYFPRNHCRVGFSYNVSSCSPFGMELESFLQSLEGCVGCKYSSPPMTQANTSYGRKWSDT